MTYSDDSESDNGNLSYAASTRRATKGWLITVGVVSGLLLMLVLRLALSPKQVTPGPVGAPSSQRPTDAELRDLQLRVDRQQRWQTKVEPRLAVADQACTESIDKAVRVLSDFVGECKNGARPFAKAMLTFSSKWKLVVSHIPSWLGGDSNAHRAFLEQKFNEHIFTSEHVKQAVEAAVTTYLDHVHAIENQLLVDVRTDLADLPVGAIPGSNSQEEFAKQFEQLVNQITPQVAEAMRLDVIRGLGSWIGGEIAARVAIRVLSSVATRLGVSAGILGAGASASWATFGLSVLAAVVVDLVVGKIINWATDPVGKLEERVKEMLDEVCKLVIEGEGDMPGLRAELEKLNTARARIRSEALRTIVLGE